MTWALAGVGAFLVLYGAFVWTDDSGTFDYWVHGYRRWQSPPNRRPWQCK